MNEELKTLASVASSQRERQAPTSGLCLGTDEILAFVQGQMPDEGLDVVHAHVDECDVCQCLVAEAAHALDSEPISESTRTSWNTVFQPNTMVGKRYRILRLVARGGMGEVYEAYDTALHERVAVKTVTSTSCDNTHAVRALKAEVQLARRISHPNVCRIYDLGTHEMEPSGHEIYFLVMEFVEGECLGKKLRQDGAFALDQAQSVAQQLLLGLRAAHDSGILHRDLKSDNVMLRTESDGRITPVILDFGLAKALNESGLIATTQTSQAMVGTIGYMAPEQIEGAPLSMASDLYAFGVVWFELLTGKLPFVGDTPVATAMARLHRAPLAPSSINPNVPAWLDELVLRCLRRHPEERFATAGRVLDELTRRREAQRMRTLVPSRFRRKASSWTILMFVFGVAATAYVFTQELRQRDGVDQQTKLREPQAANAFGARVPKPGLPVGAPSTSHDATRTADRAVSLSVSEARPQQPVSLKNAPSNTQISDKDTAVPGQPKRGPTVVSNSRGSRRASLGSTLPVAVPPPSGDPLPTLLPLEPVKSPVKTSPVPASSHGKDEPKNDAPDWLPLWPKEPTQSELEAVDDGRVAR